MEMVGSFDGQGLELEQRIPPVLSGCIENIEGL